MPNLIIPVIPTKPVFIGEKKTLDYKAICVYAALGFFLDDDTFYKEQKVLSPACSYEINGNKIQSKESYFSWHYSPKERSLNEITEEFAELFEQIIKKQTQGQKVILPLSGGLDSRTQAAALHYLDADVNGFSYCFEGGHDETQYAGKIAEKCGFPFQSWKVSKGYLWNKLEQLAQINGCYSEFTHPRQMAFIDKYEAMGDVFSLGHWGDVLFDDMGVENNLSFEQQVDVLLKKVVKKGGMELAVELWKAWGLEGDFKNYLYERVKELLGNINIPENANAQIRAFKSLYWAPRWTSVNLAVFENVKPISVPYYDNSLCEFVCSVPEKYLANRQIQIEYIKMRNPELAGIPWQSQRPFNLYNYHLNRMPYNLPYRLWSKAKRSLSKDKYIQRNWELQFLGKENERQLQDRLFKNQKMEGYIPKQLLSEFYNKFKNENAVYYSHPVSMLLTLSEFFNRS